MRILLFVFKSNYLVLVFNQKNPQVLLATRRFVEFSFPSLCSYKSTLGIMSLWYSKV